MRRPPQTPAPRRVGFTLIEVVLAVGILVLGASAILGILTFGAALTRSAELRAAAASAMESVEADLDQVLFPYEDGEVGEPVEIVERQVPGAPGVVYSAKATQNPDLPREYRVDVQVRWLSAGVQRSRDYTLLRLRQIEFGERLRRDFVETDRLRRSKPPAETPKEPR